MLAKIIQDTVSMVSMDCSKLGTLTVADNIIKLSIFL